MLFPQTGSNRPTKRNVKYGAERLRGPRRKLGPYSGVANGPRDMSSRGCRTRIAFVTFCKGAKTCKVIRATVIFKGRVSTRGASPSLATLRPSSTCYGRRVTGRPPKVRGSTELARSSCGIRLLGVGSETVGRGTPSTPGTAASESRACIQGMASTQTVA